MHLTKKKKVRSASILESEHCLCVSNLTLSLPKEGVNMVDHFQKKCLPGKSKKGGDKEEEIKDSHSTP